MSNNIKPNWFFSHTAKANGVVGGLPHCPCKHKHGTLEEGERCATGRHGTKGTHVREVCDGVAVADHPVRS